jgi:hypothetical protein
MTLTKNIKIDTSALNIITSLMRLRIVWRGVGSLYQW